MDWNTVLTSAIVSTIVGSALNYIFSKVLYKKEYIVRKKGEFFTKYFSVVNKFMNTSWKLEQKARRTPEKLSTIEVEELFLELDKAREIFAVDKIWITHTTSRLIANQIYNCNSLAVCISNHVGDNYINIVIKNKEFMRELLNKLREMVEAYQKAVITRARVDLTTDWFFRGWLSRIRVRLLQSKVNKIDKSRYDMYNIDPKIKKALVRETKRMTE